MENILLKIKESTNALTAYLNEAQQNNKKLAGEVATASNAYKKDVNERERKIKEQIKVLELQKKEISLKAEALRPNLVNATASGYTKEIMEIQNRIATLKAQESAIDTQVEFLYTTPIKGDDKLFDIARKLNDKLNEDNRKLKSDFDLYEIAEENIRFWEKIKDDSINRDLKTNFSYEFNGINNLHHSGGKCIDKPKSEEISQKPSTNIEIGRWDENGDFSSPHQPSRPRW